MENIYNLQDKYISINAAYDELQAALADMYEDNGGEVTEATEAMQAKLDELAAMKKSIENDILAAPDEYAAIVKNAEAQKNILDAELKALKAEQAKAVAKYQAKINRQQSKIDFFKQSITDAMNAAGVNKIGGAKTPNKFSIYFQKSLSVEVDDEKLLNPYQPRINAFRASLPAWITLRTDINLSQLKKADEMPDGATLNENKNLQIR